MSNITRTTHDKSLAQIDARAVVHRATFHEADGVEFTFGRLTSRPGWFVAGLDTDVGEFFHVELNTDRADTEQRYEKLVRGAGQAARGGVRKGVPSPRLWVY